LELDAPTKKYLHLFLIGKQIKSGINLVQPLLDQIDSKCITIFEYLTDSELKFIYQNVQLVIHPSINEGFGLPAFEAFGEGAPIAVHMGLPASQYLASKSQVTTLDMTNTDQVKNLLANVDQFSRSNVNERRKFLIQNNMTWELICAQYVNYYLSDSK
jgi:glycosyltransferase involved in cell wall biosynthesis